MIIVHRDFPREIGNIKSIYLKKYNILVVNKSIKTNSSNIIILKSNRNSN